MRYWILSVLTALTLSAQTGSYDMANLREDVRLLNQRVGELSLRVEQLERENQGLQRKADTGNEHYATLVQLNDAIGELSRSLKQAIAASKQETLQQVSVQLEKLANQTNAAIESVSRGQGAMVRSSAAGAGSSSASGSNSGFSDSYPKDGVSYTVAKGDTLARIAQKTGAKREDIINANKISDPSKLMAGQVLFIPIAK
jgi:LysM repeat protein